jgi:hypothetical protein
MAGTADGGLTAPRLSPPGPPPPLRAGMSVTAEIDTGHQRELPGFVQTALAWAGHVTEPGSAQARSR